MKIVAHGQGKGNSAIPATDFDANGTITALDAYLYVGNLLAR